jgi:hypothetical protein
MDPQNISSEDQNCPKCGRLCKGKRGYAIHVNKCSEDPDANKTCPHCNIILSSVHSKERHFSVCLPYHLFMQRQEYDKKIELLNNKHSLEIKTLSDTHKSIVQNLNQALDIRQQEIYKSEEQIVAMQREKENLKKTYDTEQKKQTREIYLLRKTIDQKDKEIIYHSHNSLELAKTLQSKPAQSTTNNLTNNINTLNQNIVQIYAFDSTKLQNKIPDNLVFKNTKDLVSFLQSQGITDYYRVTDKSRNNLLWIRDGEEIKDRGGMALAQKISESIHQDLIYQKERVQRSLQNPSLSMDDHCYFTSGERYVSKLIQRSPDEMKNIGKSLSQIGLHCKDSSPATQRSFLVTEFKVFSNCIRGVLLEEFEHWSYPDFYQLGQILQQKLGDKIGEYCDQTINDRWMYAMKMKKSKKLTESFDIETQENIPYIYIYDDNRSRRLMRPKDFANLLTDTIKELLDEDIFHTIQVLLDKLLEFEESSIRDKSKQRMEELIEWIQDPSYFDQQEETGEYIGYPSYVLLQGLTNDKELK